MIDFVNAWSLNTIGRPHKKHDSSFVGYNDWTQNRKNVAFCDRGIMAEIILKKFKVGVVHRDLKNRKDLQR